MNRANEKNHDGGVGSCGDVASEPQEIVDYILFMASPKGRSITGSTHVIDAGRLVMSRSSTASALQDGSGKNYRK